ncbi:MAG: GNAT family N-acetyltransferase [Caldicoprobacterales bacterium]|jgi:RimJ/RimL family protein N-acetyltransferase|nr:GNAT family N-acetyltransferase [Clostridiales bacterium]
MWKSWHSMISTGENLMIRPAYPSDAAAFVDTLEEVSKEGIYLLHEHASRTVSEQERIIQYLDRSRNLIAVAALDNRIVGGIGIFVGGSSPKSQFFCNLGIHLIKSARARGIGSKLMTYGISWAEQKNYHKICLSVFSTNVRAISLYKKLGFVVEGRRREQYYFMNQWVDEVLMAKFL